MDSLIAIEQSFQYLFHRLEHQSSHRIALSELIEFFQRVYHRRRPEVFQSYFIQLFPILSEHFEKDSVKFRSPEFYELLLVYLEQLSNGQDLGDFRQRFQTIQYQTRLHQSLMWLWLGEWRRFVSAWQSHWFQKHETVVRSLPETVLAGGSPEDFLRWAQRLTELGFPMPELFAELEKLWRSLTEPEDPEAVWVPLIEKERSDIDDVYAATVEAMRLEVNISPGTYHRDFLTFNYQIESSNDLMYQQAYDALSSIKKMLQKRYPSFGEESAVFRFHFVFSRNEYRYTGDSLGVAMALLNLCQMTQNGNYRRIFKLKEKAVATGIINSLGELRPINVKSLAEKLRVFYFSPFRYFLLPAENLSEAKQILDPLRREYPDRQFTLVPISSVDDLTSLDMILESRERPILLRKRLFRFFRFFWPILSLLPALLLGYLLLFDHDSNPVSIKGNGNYLLAYNQKGKLLWNKVFPVSMEFLNQNGFPGKDGVMAIGDVDGDALNDFLITIVRHPNDSPFLETYFLNDKGKTLWRFSDFEEERYGEYVHTNRYRGRFHFLHDFDKDGKMEIIGYYTNDPYYPTQLIQFDHAGAIKSVFYHSGYLSSYQIYDLDKDGVDELILGGTNNDYDTAVLMVLKYPHFSGHSPQIDSNYVIIKENADHRPPYLYLRFPDLDGLPGQVRESISQMEFINDDMMVLSLNLAGADSEARVNLGSEFQVHKIVLTDGFKLYMDYYHTFDWENFDMKGYLEQFSKVEFWNGAAFTKMYAINPR
jgi:hypothetical protein